MRLPSVQKKKPKNSACKSLMQSVEFRFYGARFLLHYPSRTSLKERTARSVEEETMALAGRGREGRKLERMTQSLR